MGEAQYVVECYPYGPILLSRNEKFTIGRRPSNVLVLPLSSVSRDHAAIEWGGDAFYLFDLNSSNGTHVNGKPTKMHRLELGDRVRVGPFGMTFRVREGDPQARQAERGMLFAETTQIDRQDFEMGLPFQAEDEADLGGTRVIEVKPKEREDTQKTGPAIRGKLSDVALVELIQFLEQNRKTGTLRIDGPEQGEFFLKQGRIINAVCGDIKGEEAAFRLLHLVEGTFEMESKPPECEVTITTSTAALIFEALRKADEHARSGSKTIS
ncbi:MAG: DUF4388 domain-containing protein [Planctomycetota bacterium]|nr:DUF4388 domain-containing protein [Planctomycetota bacterium]